MTLPPGFITDSMCRLHLSESGCLSLGESCVDEMDGITKSFLAADNCIFIGFSDEKQTIQAFCKSLGSKSHSEAVQNLENEIKDKTSFLNNKSLRKTCCFCETTFSTTWSRNRHLLRPCARIEFARDRKDIERDEDADDKISSENLICPELQIPTFIREYHMEWEPGTILADEAIEFLYRKGSKLTERQELLQCYLSHDPSLKDHLAPLLDTESINELNEKLGASEPKEFKGLSEADSRFIIEYKLWLSKRGGRKGCGVSENTARQYAGYLFYFDNSFHSALQDQGATLTSLLWNDDGNGRIKGRCWTTDTNLPGVGQARACAYQSLLNFVEMKFEESTIPPGSSSIFSQHTVYGKSLAKEKKLVTNIIKEMKTRSLRSTKAKKLLLQTANPEFYHQIDDALSSYFDSSEWIGFVKEVMDTDQIINALHFQRIVDVLAILLVITNGQRPQVAEFLEESDVRAMHRNKFDDNLFTIPVQVEKNEKEGKNSSQIYLGVDTDMKSLLFKFLDLRSLFIQTVALPRNPDTLFFNAKSGYPLAMKNIYTSVAWKEMKFPGGCTISSFRRAVATFFSKDKISKDLDPAVLQNHSSEIRQNTYYTAGLEDFELGHSQLRQQLIPHSAVIPEHERAKLIGKEKEELSKFKMSVQTSLEVQSAKRKTKLQRPIRANWSISSRARFVLIQNIVSGVHPPTSVLMLSNVPTDSASRRVKPWKSMMSQFLLHPKNEGLLNLLRKEALPCSVDPAGELVVAVRHCLYDWNRDKGLFEFKASKRKYQPKFVN